MCHKTATYCLIWRTFVAKIHSNLLRAWHWSNGRVYYKGTFLVLCRQIFKIQVSVKVEPKILKTTFSVSCPKYDVQRGGSRHDMARRPTPSNEAVSSGGLVEEKQWSCSECTFLNHPALQTCEECDMPRIVIGTTAADIAATTVERRQLAAAAAKRCFCHTRTVVAPPPVDPVAPMSTERRRVKSDKSFDELPPVPEVSPCGTLTNNSNYFSHATN